MCKLPTDFPQRILVAVTGLTPQIITETLYALAMRQPPFWPTEIHVLTTEEGARRIRLQLLGDDGWLARLRRDYQLPEVLFGMEQVHVVKGADVCLRDIHTKADNAAIGDAACRLLRELSTRENAALHVSIAGGRKTMGFYMGYALSLFARPQDRLSHVLVSPLYESLPAFFYPTPQSNVIFARDETPLDTAKAEVSLAEIPFVRLRDRLPEALRSGRHDFSQTIAAAQEALAEHRLRIDLAGKRLYCNDHEVHMPPLPFAFYSWQAKCARDGMSPVTAAKADAAAFLRHYRRIHGSSGNYQRIVKRLGGDRGRPAFDCNTFTEYRNSAYNALKKHLSEELAAAFMIHSIGQRPHTTYALKLPPSAIEFIGGEE